MSLEIRSDRKLRRRSDQPGSNIGGTQVGSDGGGDRIRQELMVEEIRSYRKQWWRSDQTGSDGGGDQIGQEAMVEIGSDWKRWWRRSD